jgi:hypothetical protein
MLARGLLAEHNIDPDKDRIVVIHGESSCALRSLSAITVAEVAKAFANDGFKVITPTMQDYSVYLRGEYRAVTDNIVSLRQELLSESIPPRVVFAATAFAELFVAVDSIFSHLAAALDIPALLIYGSFDPGLRAKYYTNAYILFKPLPCAPCQQIGGFCARYPGGLPPCMKQYQPREIYKLAKGLIDGDIKPAQPAESIEFKPEEVRCCPVCSNDRAVGLTRKGQFFYVRCRRCGTIYTHRTPTDEELSVETKENFGPTEKHIAQYGALIQQVARAHKVPGQKVQLYASREVTDKVAEHLESKGWGITTGKRKYDIVAFVFDLERSENPLERLQQSCVKLKTGGVIFIYGASANTYRNYNNWLPFNPPICGQNQVIVGKKGIEFIAEKLNLELLKYDIVGDNAIVTLRKRKNGKVSR